MENTKKYYTPEIEEFHIGFEYEWLDENKLWNKATPIEISRKNFDEQTYGLRVKYLDKEDIESLGFEFIKEDKFSKYFKFQNFNLQTVKNGTHGIHIAQLDEDGHSIVFKGIVKNKSEFKKLIKQLNIT